MSTQIALYARFDDYDSNRPARIFAEAITGNEGAINARLGEIEANNGEVLDSDADGVLIALRDGTTGNLLSARDDGGVIILTKDENGNPLRVGGFIAELL